MDVTNTTFAFSPNILRFRASYRQELGQIRKRVNNSLGAKIEPSWWLSSCESVRWHHKSIN